MQPAAALGAALQAQGHRVRVATHDRYRAVVEGGAGVGEFYPLGGDPGELAKVAVRSQGILPTR